MSLSAPPRVRRALLLTTCLAALSVAQARAIWLHH
jgi:hypothetical protein